MFKIIKSLPSGVLNEIFSQRISPYNLFTNYTLKSSMCITAQKIKFSFKDFFSKCDKNRNFLRIWSHLLKTSVMENLTFSGMIHIWRPWKLSSFQDPLPPCPSTSKLISFPWPWTSNFRQIPPSPSDDQSMKRKHNPKITIICYQLLPSGRLSFSV